MILSSRLIALLLLTISSSLLHADDNLAAKQSNQLPKIRVASDGRTFTTEQGSSFVPMGVTYYRPGTGWAPQLWKKWDAESTRRDFVLLKEMGVNCVRVFLSYGSFCLEPGVLATNGLAKFDQLLTFAEQTGIYVHPTGLDHWEGVPDWAHGDRYAEESLLQAQEAFWRLFVARYRGRNVIFAYDLLNEPEVRWDSPAMGPKWNQWLRQKYGSAVKRAEAWGTTDSKPQLDQVPVPAAKDAPGNRELFDYQLFRESIADEWTRRQAVAIRASDPAALVTVGLIQWSVPSLLPGVQHYAGFRPERQAKFLDFLEVHFYPLEHGAYEYRDLNEEHRNLAYLEGVVSEVAKAGKPVVVAEFGWYGGGKPTFDRGVHPAASEDQQARWCTNLVRTTAGLATGWLNWGFYDHPQAGDCSQLTGLITTNGTPKAWGREFKALSGRYRHEGIPVRPRLGPRPTLDWDLCLTSLQAEGQFRQQYLKAFEADLERSK